MRFEVKWVDVTPHLLARQQPVISEAVLTGLIRRDQVHQGPKAWAGPSQVGTVGDYWVVKSPLLGDEPAEFAPSLFGEAVAVPMFAYKTSQLALADLFGLGVQIGMAAIADLRNHTRDEPKVVHLVLGHECTDLRPAEEALRAYVGIAVQTR